MRYRAGYKYQLADDEITQTLLRCSNIKTEYITLTDTGLLVIRQGYAWDGASWALDTDSFMRGSLIHDALYQLIRMELLPPEARKVADTQLMKMCKADGMWWLRRRYVARAVRLFAGPAADPSNAKEIHEAP